MKALIYSDWCAVRGMLARILVLCPIIMVPLMVLVGDGGEEDIGVMAACMIVMMAAFYIMLAVFGADEQGDWEQMRLSLPVTSRDVVRARYAFVALASLATALVGAALGVIIGGLISLFMASGTPSNVLAVVGASLGSATGALAYLSLLMPVTFKMGLAKARIFFSLPFFLIMLLNVEPVGDAVRGMVARLDLMSDALGSPAPLVIAGALVAGVLYAISLVVSERLYAARDF